MGTKSGVSEAPPRQQEETEMPDVIEKEHGRQVLEAVKRGVISGPNFSGVIARSWTRCVNDYALNPDNALGGGEATRLGFDRRREASALLLSNAKAEMSSLFQQLAKRDTVVVIADASGIVLETVGDGSFARQAARVGMRPGGDWSERANGTNGIGTCLVEREMVVVDRTEHFYPRLTRLFCTGAPVFDHVGELVGVLDVTSESDLNQQHFRMLIGMSAQTIENRLFEAKFEQSACILHLHSRHELVRTFHEGLIALNGEGKILAANQAAAFQLGLSDRQGIVGRDLRELFKTTLDDIISRGDANAGQPVPVHGVCGRSFFALVRVPGRASGRVVVAGPWDAGNLARRTALQQDAGSRQGLSEPCLHGGREWGDAGMEQDFSRALRVYERGVYMLLEGETGSGKEIFAKGLHDAGSRAKGPFVAVNCAAVPENLIESELFGYRGGAFTGASREGRRGRILAADKGTLLLDEVGDMPLSLQARLLRVLEEREVTPLGGETSVKVDVRVICATHRDLREMVSAGAFRSDLYFRLAGFTVVLPPLRCRAGRGRLIRAVLAEIAPEQLMDEVAMARLEAFPWPGNLRQLRNVLQTVCALCDGETIRVSDLPIEIREFESSAMGAEAALHDVSPGADEERDAVPLAAAIDVDGIVDECGRLSYMDSAEREALLRLLRLQRWNITKVAAELGASRNTVYRKVNQYGLVRE
jgi:transcriptional regulator of acetoin/glycerol metabolism